MQRIGVVAIDVLCRSTSEINFAEPIYYFLSDGWDDSCCILAIDDNYMDATG